MTDNKKDDRLKNIRRIRENVFEIQVSNGYREDGTRDRITETVYGDEEDAIVRREQIKKELYEMKLKGQKTANSGYTFLDASKKFLEDREYSKKVGTTISSYRGLLNNHILPEIGMKKLRNITHDDVVKIYDKMYKSINPVTKELLSGTTIKHAHALITAIYNYAINKRWISYNPTLFLVNPPKFDTKEREYYDSKEIDHALSCLNFMQEHKNGVADNIIHSQNLRFKTAITILFNGGLRREELFGLKWKDIKWNTHIFELRRAIVSSAANDFDEEDIIEVISSYLVCKELKNDASRRNITMPIVCFDFLMEYRHDQQSMGLSAKDEDYIFQNIRRNLGVIWNPNNLTKEWANFIEKFNLKKITVHDIRHSHASDLLSMGVPIQDVSRRLGHSDIGTTLKIYTHSNLEQDKLIVQKLEDRYGNHYITSKLNFKIIASIIIGEYYVDERDVFNAVNFITSKKVDEINKNSLLLICKKYLLANYSYLKSISVFLNSEVSKDKKILFLDFIENICKDISKIRPMNA